MNLPKLILIQWQFTGYPISSRLHLSRSSQSEFVYGVWLLSFSCFSLSHSLSLFLSLFLSLTRLILQSGKEVEAVKLLILSGYPMKRLLTDD